MNSSLSIRNFCVISHIDHGKTTLTDRFLELTHAVDRSKLIDRFLDSNPIERERGITIKLTPVRMFYTLNAKRYTLNLIDTPGHVDFSYEVSRSLAACEGAILLVDATQGIQAQTVANAYLALDQGLELIPVINKIDLDNADVKETSRQLQDSFGFKPNEIIFVSAKTGQNVVQLIKAVIDRLPPPAGQAEASLQALVFNSVYHSHHGVIAYVRVVNGWVEPGSVLKFLATKARFTPLSLGYFSPQLQPAKSLTAGEVGFIATGLKDIALCRVGDTLTQVDLPAAAALAGYREPKPMVFMDVYPIANQDFPKLKTALIKFSLTDSSLSFSPVHSSVLGSGFKIGFQGLLHAEITQERLEREFALKLLAASPSVEYQVKLTSGQTISVFSPAEFPHSNLIKQTYEPVAELTIFTPQQYLGSVMALCRGYRAKLKDQQFFGSQVKLIYNLPVQELVRGFFNALKSSSSGFASLDWQLTGFVKSDLVKLTVVLNRQPIEPLSVLTVRSQALPLAKKLAAKLKTLIPRQQFEVPIQVCLASKVLARETLKAFRKDVTAKLYGGDQTRKDKLLEKQKKGKKHLKAIGRLHLPQEVFLAVLQA